jgi:ribonuclease P protein component
LDAKQSYKLGKSDRIKSRKLVEQLFREGTVIQVPPFRASYLQVEQQGLQFGVAVGTRHFKRAVQRNRIRRQIREAYRLQKQQLQQALQQQQKGLALFVVYTGKELPEYSLIADKMNRLLQKLTQTVHELT